MSQVQSAPYTCDSCRQPIPVCGGVSYGSLESGYRELCNRCFNEEIARSDGIDFQHVEFQPLEMLDVAGQRHEFHFRVHLLVRHGPRRPGRWQHSQRRLPLRFSGDGQRHGQRRARAGHFLRLIPVIRQRVEPHQSRAGGGTLIVPMYGAR
jgi:hypothetical protein